MATQETHYMHSLFQLEEPAATRGEIRPQKVDCEILAREAAARAYRNAKADGASDAIARKFSEIFAHILPRR
jgi:hypothetical protein